VKSGGQLHIHGLSRYGGEWSYRWPPTVTGRKHIGHYNGGFYLGRATLVATDFADTP